MSKLSIETDRGKRFLISADTVTFLCEQKRSKQNKGGSSNMMHLRIIQLMPLHK